MGHLGALKVGRTALACTAVAGAAAGVADAVAVGATAAALLRAAVGVAALALVGLVATAAMAGWQATAEVGADVGAVVDAGDWVFETWHAASKAVPKAVADGSRKIRRVTGMRPSLRPA